MKIEDVHIVILSSIKWDFLWQRHQIIAEYFSQFTDVTFVETTGLRNPNFLKSVERLYRGFTFKGKKKLQRKKINILPPIVAPPTFKLFRTINQHIFTPTLASKIITYSNKPILVISYLPTTTAHYLIDELNPMATIYDCVLNFENFPGIPKDIVATEDALIRRADLLIVDSGFLMRKHQDKGVAMKQIPSAVDFERFYQVSEGYRASSGALRATYFGGIDHYRIDWGIIEQLLAAGVTVELIGPAPDGIPIEHESLIYKGTVPHDELPHALRDCDVLILPYKITEFTKGTYPAKLFECFATGKPIISTPLPDLISYRHLIGIAETPSLFTEKVLVAGREDDENRRNRRIELARENSWEVRCHSYLEAVEQVLLETSLNQLVQAGSRSRLID
ncbi:hypothetical protein CD29_14530 [Ureibacillus manganicus DSM 26584]|uniref:Uncharacterized protein n=1 Tax=Ureibacillus manganicus DSM 26584 TaxID=1384049 RepID=A0A0A3I2A9_9BACL|nr:hypothetical protein CD29_14530 [Ureibacillus manganicus DSM 26584]